MEFRGAVWGGHVHLGVGCTELVCKAREFAEVVRDSADREGKGSEDLALGAVDVQSVVSQPRPSVEVLSPPAFTQQRQN